MAGENMYYDSKPMFGTDFEYPAIIDSGSSQLSVPPKVMKKIRAEWKKVAGDEMQELKVSTAFKGKCDKWINKLKPIAIQMNGMVYEIPASAYLWESQTKCYTIVHKCNLPPRLQNLFLVGDTFLNHFYSVYNFDKDTVGLGVNIHSKGKAFIWKKGGKPPTQSERLPESAKPGFLKYNDK